MITARSDDDPRKKTRRAGRVWWRLEAGRDRQGRSGGRRGAVGGVGSRQFVAIHYTVQLAAV
jgi:hypothetical protein